MKTKSLIKISITILSVFILFTNCEREINIEPAEIAKEKRFNKISLEEFNSKMLPNDVLRSFNRRLDVTRPDSGNGRNDLTNEAIILTDYIIAVENYDETQYTFKVLDTNSGNKFYNLILFANGNGEITDSNLLEYTPSEVWLDDPSQVFNGHVKMIENTVFSVNEINDLLNSRSYRSGRCLTGVSTEWECNAGNDHAPDTCTAGGSDLIVALEYGPCPPEISEEDDNSAPAFPIDNNSAGGGGGGNYNSESSGSTSPLPPCGFTFDGNYGDDCLSPGEYNVALELGEILGEGDSFEFDNSLIDAQTINVNSVDEIQQFFDAMVIHNFVSTSSIMEPGSIQRDVKSLRFSDIPQVDIVATITAMVPDANNDLECLQILNTRTELDGDSSVFHWTQLDAENTTLSNSAHVDYNEELDHVKISIQGKMKIGFDLGYLSPLSTTRLMTVVLIYEYSSGNFVTNQSYWYFTNYLSN